MALKDCVYKEVTFKISCDVAHCEVVNIVADTSTVQAARTFKTRGWTELNGDVFCPRCSKLGRE